MNTELLKLFIDNSLNIDCQEMKLWQSKNSKIIYRGVGSIYNRINGELEFKMFLFEKISILNIQSIKYGEPGQIIKEDDYFTLEGTDSVGGKWIVKNIIPKWEYNNELNSFFIQGKIKELQNDHSINSRSKYHELTFGFYGDIKIPYNTSSKTEKFLGNIMTFSSNQLNVAKFRTNGLDFIILNEKRWLSINIVSENKMIKKYMIVRILESLQFVLGTTLYWSYMQIKSNIVNRTILRKKPFIKNKIIQKPPIEIDSFDTSNKVWDLLGKYLLHVFSYKGTKTWSPIFAEILSVIKSNNNLFNLQAITLSVAIEGLLKLYFEKLGIPDDKTKAQIEEAKTIYNNSELFDYNFKQRLEGTFEAFERPRAKDILRKLNRYGYLQIDLINKYNKLRNPSIHADNRIEPLQEYLNLINSNYILFLQIIFLAIGYSGEFKDYSKIGYPSGTFEAKEYDRKGKIL